MKTPNRNTSSDSDEPVLSQRRSMVLAFANVALGAALAATLVYMIVKAPFAPSGGTTDELSLVSAIRVNNGGLRQALIDTLLTMIVAGGAGATLCNLRGLFRWMSTRGGRFPVALETPFIIRPVTGGLTGLVVFFAGNLVVSALDDHTHIGWLYFQGRLPYVGFALLAGFASQEFMQRLKEVAKTAFGPGGREMPTGGEQTMTESSSDQTR